MVVKIVIVFVECQRMTHTPLVSQCNSQGHWSVTSVWLDGHVCTIFCIREQRQMVTKHWKLLIVTFQKWMSVPKSAFTHSLWFPLTAYRSGVPPFLKNRNVFFVFVFKVEVTVESNIRTQYHNESDSHVSHCYAKDNSALGFLSTQS